MNRLERIDAAVTRWTADGVVGAAVWLPDGTLLADLVAVARAVGKLRAAQHRVHDLEWDIGRGDDDAAIEERDEAMVDVFDALDPLMETIEDV